MCETSDKQLQVPVDGCLPKADKMAADQKISPMSAGMKSSPPILFPYSCWKGSSMVT